jgi:hypothetical protein
MPMPGNHPDYNYGIIAVNEGNVTPIVHSAIGLLGWQKSGSEKNIKTLFLFILVSNLPDIDFLFLLLMGSRDSQLHQSYTHNIFFIGLVTLFLFGVFKTGRERVSLFLVAVSHLVLDLIIIDPVAPVGFRMFFPLWDELFNFGIFPNFLRGNLSDIFSWHNVKTVTMEVVFFVLPIFYLCGSDAALQLKKKEFWKIS